MARHRLECQTRITRNGVTYPCPGHWMLWGDARKVRPLARGEEARDGFDVLPCPKCGQKWEVDRGHRAEAA